MSYVSHQSVSIISLQSIQRPVFVMQIHGVLCELQNGSLCIMYINFNIQRDEAFIAVTLQIYWPTRSSLYTAYIFSEPASIYFYQ